jgi:beta-lactamase class A
MRRFLTLATVLVALLAIFPLYSRLKVVAAPIPPGVYLGGILLSDMKDREQIRSHLQAAYQGPIAVQFADKRLALKPDDVNFYLDVDAMLAEAARYLDGPAFLDIAWRYALGFGQQRRDVPTRFMVDNDKVRAWLQSVAAEYNTDPQPPRAVAQPQSDVVTVTAIVAETATTETLDEPVDEATAAILESAREEATAEPPLLEWEWIEGSPGHTLDIEASIPRITAALADTENRVAELALVETPPPTPSMADLARILDNMTVQFPGFASIYVHDLTHGDEAAVDADVAFSGMSTLKIGIAAAIMRKLNGGVKANDPDSQEVGQWLDYALGESNNLAANLLLKWLGDGSVQQGTQVFTDFMQSLGFDSTYMQSGYDFETQLAEQPTPGNQQAEWDTDPDSNLQSTPREMGRILSAIYECTQGKGLLVETYPDEISADECSQILYYMTHDEFREMLWAGLPDPDQRWIVHKHGFAFESHSDVGLIWGPSGPYVMSVFLYRSGWMDWATSNSTLKNLSRATWKFFEFQRAEEGNREPPVAPVLQPPPGFVPVTDVAPSPAASAP